MSATFSSPIDAETRETPSRHVAIVAVLDTEGVTKLLAVEEDGLLSRFNLDELCVGWRWSGTGWEVIGQPQEAEGDEP